MFLKKWKITVEAMDDGKLAVDIDVVDVRVHLARKPNKTKQLKIDLCAVQLSENI